MLHGGEVCISFSPTTSTNSKILQDELLPKDVLESYQAKSWTWNELLEIWGYQTKKLEVVNFNLQYVE